MSCDLIPAFSRFKFQNLPNLYSKVPLGKRLLDKARTPIQNASINYDIGGTTRHKKKLRVRVERFNLQGKVLAAHYRGQHYRGQRTLQISGSIYSTG